MNEIVDMAKAAGAGTSGVGIWYINEISAFVQLGVSVACLIYLVLKSIFLNLLLIFFDSEKQIFLLSLGLLKS